jgi:hypothetical protein
VGQIHISRLELQIWSLEFEVVIFFSKECIWDFGIEVWLSIIGIINPNLR